MHWLKINFALTFTVLLSCVTAQENSWVKLNDFGGGKRERAVAFSINDIGYVGTGTDTAEVVQSDFWKYDYISDAWTQIAPIPGAARRDAVAFTIDGYGYVGTGMSEHVSANGIVLSDFWRYNPTINQWDSIAPFPGNQGGGVYFATGFCVAGKGYVCGGKTGNSTYSNELWEYKPSTNAWIQRAPFPTGIRYMLSSFAIGNYAYVGLGATQDVYKRDLFRYNPGNNQWVQMPDLPGNVRGAASTFVIQDKGYICGGTDGGVLDDLWEFDPLTQTWEIKAYYGGSERKHAIAFSINNEFGILGLGKGYSGKKESIYGYNPNNYAGLTNKVASAIKIYPNPGRETINILNLPENIGKITCVDAAGTCYFKTTESIPSDAFSMLPSGIYFLNFYAKNGGFIAVKTIAIR